MSGDFQWDEKDEKDERNTRKTKKMSPSMKKKP